MTKSSGYRTDVQGLRAIAVLLVLLFHFETRLRGGYLGVDMFFVISGFVIASSTLREIDRTGTFSWGAFLHRRVRRLLPGIALVSVATAVLSILLLSPFGPQQETAKMLLSAATYTSNFVLMPQSYFSLDPKANPLLHLWSLAVEEQFYFMWPIAIMMFVGVKRRMNSTIFRFVVWTSVVIVLFVSCWLFLMCSIHGSHVNDYRWFRPLIQRSVAPEHFAFYSPFTRAWEFVAGIFVALLLRSTLVIWLHKSASFFSCSGASLVVAGVAWASKFPEIQHESTWSTNTMATLSVVTGTSLWIAGGEKDRLFKPVLSLKFLTHIGDSSYSIYLLHWPIWVLLITSFKQESKVIVIAFVLSLGLGWLQFRFVENPIRLRKKIPKFKTLQFVGAFCLIALAGHASMAALSPVIAQHLAGKRPDELSLHIIEKPCVEQKLNFDSATTCIYNGGATNGIAVLVGDSMAKSLSDGFVQAANEQGLTGYVFSYPGCAFQLADSPFSATNECSAWRADVNSALKKIEPKIVLIANLNSLYVENPLPNWSRKDTELIWGSELTRTLTGLAELHAPVIIVQPPPRFAYDLRYDLSLLWPNSVKEPRSAVVARRSEINEIEVNTLTGFDFVRPIVNFTDQFCNAEICDPKINGEFMLEDDDHLSVDGSQLVIPQISAAIGEALNR